MHYPSHQNPNAPNVTHLEHLDFEIVYCISGYQGLVEFRIDLLTYIHLNYNFIFWEDCHKCEKGNCIEDAATDGEVCFDEMLIGGVGNCVSGACNGTSVGCSGIKCDECQMCHLGMCVPQPDGDVSCSSMFYPNPTCRQGKCIQDSTPRTLASESKLLKELILHNTLNSIGIFFYLRYNPIWDQWTRHYIRLARNDWHSDFQKVFAFVFC